MKLPTKLNQEQLNAHLSEARGWRQEGDAIRWDCKFGDFKQAMNFVNRVAEIAEALDHHPDILIHGWNNVRLTVTTHDQGGLTEKDFRLAERVNELV